MGRWLVAKEGLEPGAVHTERLPRKGTKKTLIAPLAFRSYEVVRGRQGAEVVVPAGFETDFFSVPRPLWSLFPRDGRGVGASVIHDHILQNLGETYTDKEADRIFSEALAACDIGAAKRWTLWAGVRVGSFMR